MPRPHGERGGERAAQQATTWASERSAKPGTHDTVYSLGLARRASLYPGTRRRHARQRCRVPPSLATARSLTTRCAAWKIRRRLHLLMDLRRSDGWSRCRTHTNAQTLDTWFGAASLAALASARRSTGERAVCLRAGLIIRRAYVEFAPRPPSPNEEALLHTATTRHPAFRVGAVACCAICFRLRCTWRYRCIRSPRATLSPHLSVRCAHQL